MDVNAVEVAQNTQSEVDRYLQNKNLFVRMFYRTNRQQLTYFLIVYLIIILIIFFFLVSELEAMGFGDLYLGILTALVGFGYAAFAASMCCAFKRKEEKIRKLGISGNQQPMTDEEMEQFRRLAEEDKRREAQLKIDEENKELLRLLLKSEEENEQLQRLLEEQKKLPARKVEISPDDCGVPVTFPVVKQGSGSQGAGYSKSIQIHSPPVGTPVSGDSSETSGRGHDTMAISEKHDESSVTGEVTDLAVCSDDLDRISVVETEEENSEELLTKTDELEQLETKESAASSLLEEAKYAEKSDSLPGGGEDCQSLLEKSDAVNDTLPKDKDEDDETASSYAPPEKQTRKSSA